MTPDRPTILLFGTFDTKLEPLLLLHSLLLSQTPAPKVLIADVGRTPSTHPLITISHSSFLSRKDRAALPTLSRNEVITTLSTSLAAHMRQLHATGKIHAAISFGGSSGTSLAADAMRSALPIGFPKLIVTTMASGQVGHYVGDSDLTLMPSIVDIAGTNRILTMILRNAAGAVAGMAAAAARAESTVAAPQKKAVAISMFGVTTPAVMAAQELLEARGYEVYALHATGSGGRVLERLVAEGAVDAVLDLTTTELADELCGGILSAGPDRLSAAGKAGIPQIISTGATDCINFGPMDTVPEAFKTADRNVVEHNPSVTLVRTNEDECRRLGEIIATRILKNSKRRELVEVWCPMLGVSALSERGSPFSNPDADRALVTALTAGLEGSGVRVVVESEAAINDEWFARGMAQRLVELMVHSGEESL